MASLEAQYAAMKERLMQQRLAAIKQATAALKIEPMICRFEGGLKYEVEESADIMQAITDGIAYANEVAAEALENALNIAMQSSSWGWRDGSRDIVDTGELMRSLEIIKGQDGLSVSYSSPYAELVHYGGYIVPYGNDSISKVYIPGRPWMDAVLEGGGPVPSVDLSAIYEEAIDTRIG
jgi:phage gpG-like protein